MEEAWSRQGGDGRSVGWWDEMGWSGMDGLGGMGWDGTRWKWEIGRKWNGAMGYKQDGWRLCYTADGIQVGERGLGW